MKKKIKKSKPTRVEIINAAKRAALQSGGLLSKSEFSRRTGIDDYYIYRLFPTGGWVKVQKLAGIPPHPKYYRRIPDNELIKEYHRVTSSLGEIPTWPIFLSHSKFSQYAFWNHFGSTRAVLKRYLEYLHKNFPGSPLIKKAQARLVDLTRRPQPNNKPQSADKHGSGQSKILNFRGLQHPPKNEQGVACLFAMVSQEMGFLIESIRTTYPDCEAKRRVAYHGWKDIWRNVRIEFEYRSSSFREHKHDPSRCDIIVCWKHDWPACPLEVIELSRVVELLPQR